MKNSFKKSASLSFAALAGLGLTAPLSAQDVQTVEPPQEETVQENQETQYTMPAAAEWNLNRTRAEILPNIYATLYDQAGVYWQSNDEKLRIGAFYERFHEARDGTAVMGDPKAQKRQEYILQARIRF